ncbi:MAG: DUF882 domain-containing protein [Methylococcaceae bacterium]
MNEQLIKNTKIDEDITIASRRKFLKKLAYGSVLALSGCGVETAAVRHVGRHGFTQQTQAPAPYLHSPGYKTLSFEHTHTGEKLKLTYFERGNYIKDALQEINYLLRDFRTDDIHPIDTALLDQLFDLKQTLGLNKPFHIISGYRSPFTNAQLHKHSHGVAKQSFHMQGRAIDIRVEGVSSKMIKNAALTLAQGGVGYYPRSNFVHLDSGRFRTW